MVGTGNTAIVKDIVLAGGGVKLGETWTVVANPDGIVWRIEREYLAGGTLDDTYFSGFDFNIRTASRCASVVRLPLTTGRTLRPPMKKPFDMLAEGLLVSSSREFRTPVELFLAGVAGWEPHVIHLLLAA